MFAEFVLYGIVVLALSACLVLLGSKALAEKFVALGMLPGSFLAFVPALRSSVRVVGVLMVVGGLLGVCVANGWINPEIIRKYGFSAALLVIGAILLVFTSRD